MASGSGADVKLFCLLTFRALLPFQNHDGCVLYTKTVTKLKFYVQCKFLMVAKHSNMQEFQETIIIYLQ